MKAILILLASLLCACQSSFQPTFNLSDPLPFEPMALQGKLDNGLRYLILPSDDPKGRVYMRLVINAGSMNEDDDQKGIAHLVEHMAFNGSEQYPQNQIINALEQLGMKFARDINAFTDFENTVYTLNIAKNDDKTLKLALNVIDQWLNHLTILPQDLDLERGVVLEEWRARLSPMLRLGDKKSQVEMAHSRYVLRDPIGDVNIIKNVTAQRVKDFYKKWYRADNAILIVVGDIDRQQMEKLVQTQLDAPNPQQAIPLPKMDYHIPLSQQWRLATVSEKEIKEPSVEFSLFSDANDKNTVGSYQQDLWQQIVIRLMNLRFQQWETALKQQESAVINTANFYHSHLGKQTLQATFSLQLNDQRYQQAISQLFHFLAEIYQNGFTQQELNDEIQRLQKLNERQREVKATSIKMANDLIVSMANNQTVLSMEDKYRLNQQLLAQIKLSDIHRTFQQMLQLKAKLMLITQPMPQQKLSFTANQLEQEWQRLLSQPQQHWQAEQQDVTLPEMEFGQGNIRVEKRWQEQSITEFRLSNGSKLIYLYSNQSPQQVYFKAVTQGGLRSVPDNQYQALRTAVNLVDETGIGSLSQGEINRYFSRNPIAFTTVIDDEKQGFTAAGKADDLDKLLLLFRLKLQTNPISNKVLMDYRKALNQELKEHNKETVFMQQVTALRFPKRETVYSKNRKNTLDLTAQQLSALYQHYVAEKTDFTYFIVGDIDETAVQKFAKSYLATVPVKKQERVFTPMIAQIPTTPFYLTGLPEPRADVEIYFTAENQWQAENENLLDILADILQEKLRLALREQLSGVYSVNTWFSQEPFSPQLEGKIEFSCEPKRAEELRLQAHKIVDELLEKGIDPTLLTKKVAEKQNQLMLAKESILAQFGALEQSYWLTDSPALMNVDKQLVKQATKQRIEKLAQRILQKSARFDAVLTGREN
ncbi:M16 family metallopeptidase [Lonepinella sp. BR2474]|uniref:M16 family metallopeptidase n=1 Tax=Lonepinella sp. BR2474 TaxID=3434548 RepID=UPI003F6E225F